MAKLKIAALPDDKPVKVTVELPATVHRDLVAYAEILGREGGLISGRAVPFRKARHPMSGFGARYYRAATLPSA